MCRKQCIAPAITTPLLTPFTSTDAYQGEQHGDNRCLPSCKLINETTKPSSSIWCIDRTIVRVLRDQFFIYHNSQTSHTTSKIG